MKDSLKVEAMIRKANKIRLGGKNTGVIVELENLENKREIIHRKRLRSSIFIEDDLTRKEREIQKKLKEIAKEEKRRQESESRIQDNLHKEEKWHRWNEKEERWRKRKRA